MPTAHCQIGNKLIALKEERGVGNKSIKKASFFTGSCALKIFIIKLIKEKRLFGLIGSIIFLMPLLSPRC
jgi:hypothetical protein